MKKIFATLALIVACAGTVTARDLTQFIAEVRLINETTFHFRTCTGFNQDGTPNGVDGTVFTVSVSSVGATMFDRMHSQLLTAMIHRMRCWLTTGTSTANVTATTIYPY